MASTSDPDASRALLYLLCLGTSTSSSDLSTSDQQLTAYEADYHSHTNPASRPWVAYAHIALSQDTSSLPLPPSHQSQNAITAVRTLAIIRLKHAVDRCWRGARMVRTSNGDGGANSPKAIKIIEEDKDAVRNMLLERILTEENRGIALQAAVCIARIARSDFPTSWPDLFEKSFNALNSAATVVLSGNASEADMRHNALIMLRSAEVTKRSIKELAQVKVLSGKIRMAELAKQILPSLLSFFPSMFSATFPASASAENVHIWANSRPPAILASQIRVSHLLLKTVNILAVADVGTISARATSTSDTNDSGNLSYQWFKSTPNYLDHVFGVRGSFLEALSSNQHNTQALRPLASDLTKHLAAFGKFYLALLDKDKSRATSWAGWSDIIAWYWTKTGQAPASAKDKSRDIDVEALMPYPSTLIVHTLLLLRRSLEAWHSPANRGKPIPAPFDQDDFAVSTAEIVVDYFLPFERSALERWESDPEQWTVEEDQAQEDYASEIRPCAERLLIVLASNSRAKRVGRAIWNKFIQSTSLDVHDLTQVVRRDAVYTALGRLRDHLPATETEGPDEDSEQIKDDRIDISKAFVDRLLPEAAQIPPAVSSAWVLIRRRVCWLLYEYSEQLSPSSRAKVYEILTLLLDANSTLGGDIAVRLSAARTLGALIDDIGFDAEVFQPYLESAIRSLAELATNEELLLMDSIALSTRSLSILIERSGARVAPLVPSLTELAPALWAKEGSDECKTRPAVLTLVKSLLRATESTSAADPALSARLQSLVTPLVTSCLQPSLIPLLGIDALQLWHKAVRSAAAMQGDLFNLLGVALDINGCNSGQGPLTEIPDYASEFGRVIEEYALWFEPSAGTGPGGVVREMTRTFGPSLFSSFARVLSEDPMQLQPIQTIDVIAQSLHAGDRFEATGNLQQTQSGLQGPPTTHNGMTLLAQIASQTGLLEALVRGAILLKESSIPCSYYVAILSRLAISLPPNSFMSMVRSALTNIQASPKAPGTSADSEGINPTLLPTLQSIFLSLFPSKFETTASARRRKLIALGMSAILSGSQPLEGNQVDREVYSNVQEWVGTWLDALGEIRERNGNAPSILQQSGSSSPSIGASLLEDDFVDDDSGWLEDVSPGSARGRHLAEADIAISIKLHLAVQEALTSAQNNAPEVMQGIWGGMDPMVLDLLNKELNM
ncbi:unnamed protein product [Sympodiomycopsis kandeliae]